MVRDAEVGLTKDRQQTVFGRDAPQPTAQLIRQLGKALAARLDLKPMTGVHEIRHGSVRVLLSISPNAWAAAPVAFVPIQGDP